MSETSFGRGNSDGWDFAQFFAAAERVGPLRVTMGDSFLSALQLDFVLNSNPIKRRIVLSFLCQGRG